jgi:hypothetical protein
MKQIFFIFLRFIDNVSLPTLQITHGAPPKFKDPQSAPSEKRSGKPCYKGSSCINFISDLFNDALSISDYVASNGW